MAVGQLIADRYELKNVVGTGGMSSVYCAHDTLLERNVALKILHAHYGEDEDYVERFKREARAAAQLAHPGIVTVIDRGEQDGRQFIVFEFVDGETLKDVVEREGPQPVRRAIELGLEVGRALAFAHAQGLVHRDVKPQNVLLNGDGRAKVTDFGIARTLDAVGHTETGTVLGTSHYIAPEQARGERVDAQTDVYSFGVVLFELLAGEVPYDGDSFLSVAMRHVNEPVPSLLERRPECPLRLAALVERCLAKSPADRPASMDEVVAELEACLAELDARPDGDATMIVKAPRPERRRRARRPDRAAAPAAAPRRRRSRAPLLLVLGLLVLAAAVAALALSRDGGDGGGGGDAAAGGDAPVTLRAVDALDPHGDNVEHNDRAASATDGDATTYWPTESYYGGFDKEGVGLLLEAPEGAEPSSLTVVTEVPGWTAEIRAGDSRDGPFDRVVGQSQQTSNRTTWELEGEPARYYVVWITALDRVARINQVTAS
ncbi:MAG TPA: protein kinase [Gaiellaceae bacterium]|nr:protein kinase [Gaiellaceae bacterium]